MKLISFRPEGASAHPMATGVFSLNHLLLKFTPDVDFANQLRWQGMALGEAFLEAGRVRCGPFS